MEFRDAAPHESDVLGQLVLDGVSYWGHDVNFPDAVAGLRANGLPTSDFIAANVVEVLIDGSKVVGFYSLAPNGEDIELVHMFLQADRIGTGCGRRLWERALTRARTSSGRMLIMADPEARAFYTAMGATLERDVEASPGFALGRMWYDLDGPNER